MRSSTTTTKTDPTPGPGRPQPSQPPAAAPAPPPPPPPAAAARPTRRGPTRGAAFEDQLRALAAAGDRIAAGELAQIESRRARAAAAPAPPSPEAGPVELVHALGNPSWSSLALAPRAARAIVEALGDRERSWPVWLARCQAVAEGQLPPDAIAQPLEKTLRRLRDGPPLANPGAYALRGVANWQRENG